LAVVSAPVHAVQRDWDGPATGSWSVATNWDPDGVPDNDDHARITGATATVDPAFAGLLYDSASVNAIEPDPIPFDNAAVVDTLVREGIFSDGFESGDTSAW
jgi:hypothetical protein